MYLRGYRTLKQQITFICPHTGENVKLAKEVHCQTTNVVSLLYCKEHKKQYVGETKNASWSGLMSILLTSNINETNQSATTISQENMSNRPQTTTY